MDELKKTYEQKSFQPVFLLIWKSIDEWIYTLED